MRVVDIKFWLFASWGLYVVGISSWPQTNSGEHVRYEVARYYLISYTHLHGQGATKTSDLAW